MLTTREGWRWNPFKNPNIVWSKEMDL